MFSKTSYPTMRLLAKLCGRNLSASHSKWPLPPTAVNMFGHHRQILFDDSIRCSISNNSAAPENNANASNTNRNGGELLTLTERCVSRLREIASANERLRITVDGGGCSGFEYKFALDSKINDDDVVIEKGNARVVVDQISLDFIKGATVDFQCELIRSSFRIVRNPNAEQGCSCGASFALKSN